MARAHRALMHAGVPFVNPAKDPQGSQPNRHSGGTGRHQLRKTVLHRSTGIELQRRDIRNVPSQLLFRDLREAGRLQRPRIFGNLADFHSATFSAKRGQLSGPTTFGNVLLRLSDLREQGQLLFKRSFSRTRPISASAEFGDEGYFLSTPRSFGDKANFNAATFGDRIRLPLREFRGQGPLRLRDLRQGRANWRAAIFAGGLCHFRWTQTDGYENTHFGGAFEGARFRDVADFQTPKLLSLCRF